MEVIVLIKTQSKLITSVGIDIGTSTSHLIFSELLLRKDPASKTEKFIIAKRNIKYRGDIFLTPLKGKEIDIDRLLPILLSEYEKAGYKTTEIDTGAVIVTGESARKDNAEKIVEKLANESGKFVSATAGPNFESVISAHGSGAVDYSRDNGLKLVHADTGGGTSNIAVIDNGIITATACLSVGGRLLAVDSSSKITRLEAPGKILLNSLGIALDLGDTIESNQMQEVANALSKILIDYLSGSELSVTGSSLLITGDVPLKISKKDYTYSFSGGVAEYIYGKTTSDYGDIGRLLGQKIKHDCNQAGMKVIELPEKIRATVIGASEYTLQVSGSTTFVDPGLSLPLRNLPVVLPRVSRDKLSVEHVAREIARAMKKHDIIDGENPVALAFQDPVRTVYEKLKEFSKGIVEALPRTIEKKLPVILVFDTDIGNSVGNVLARETGTVNVLSIDEISLKEGDFIDIGKPVVENIVFPVVVKSLVFNR
ncbi:MAG: ethanolamine ammonia-lyase reactivating factor EutA [Candidatus Hodarchaeales archaeon]